MSVSRNRLSLFTNPFIQASALLSTFISTPAQAGTMCFWAPGTGVMNELETESAEYVQGVTNFYDIDSTNHWGTYELNCTSNTLLASIAKGVQTSCNAIMGLYRNQTFNCQFVSTTSQAYDFYNSSESQTPVCEMICKGERYPNACVMDTIGNLTLASQPLPPLSTPDQTNPLDYVLLAVGASAAVVSSAAFAFFAYNKRRAAQINAYEQVEQGTQKNNI